MRGVAAAAVIAMVIVGYQDIRNHQLPPPYRFLGVFLVFGAISLFAGSQPAFAAAVAWAMVLGVAVSGQARDIMARSSSDQGNSSGGPQGSGGGGSPSQRTKTSPGGPSK